MATSTKSRKRSKPRTKKAKPKRDVRMVRTSERSSYKTCRWAWDRGYNDKLKPIQEAPALRFGTLIHAALETRYPKGIKRGPHPAKTFEKLYKKEVKAVEDKWGIRADDEWTDALELGVEMMNNYVDQYGRDEEWQVLASEMTFKVPVYSPPHPDGGFINIRGERIPKRVVLFYYVGTMDGVWKNRMDGGVRVNDYKTTANDPTKVQHLILDEQATAYWTWGVDWLLKKGILKSKDQDALDGMLFTFLRKAKKDDRPENASGQKLNKDGSISKKQPIPLFHRELVYRAEYDREQARARATSEVLEMEAVKRGDHPELGLIVRKTPGSGTQSHCNWCQFRDICELNEVGADWTGLRDATMTTWDPYAAHEVKEEGKR